MLSLTGISRAPSLTHRVFMDVVGRPYLRALVFPYFVVLLLLASADANTDWTLLRDQISAVSPVLRAAIFTTLIWIWGTVAGNALRGVWTQPSVRILARLPIGSWEWVLRCFPALVLAFLPILAALWLGRASIATALGIMGLSLPVIFGASLLGRTGAAVSTAGAALVFIGLLADSYGAAGAYVGVFLSAVTLGPLVTFVRARIVQSEERDTGTLVASNIVALFVRLDALTIQRINRRAVRNVLVLTGLAAMMMAAIRINGGLSGRDALMAAMILFAIAVSPIYGGLEDARSALGKNLLRKRWPIAVTARGLAICAVVGLLATPAAVSIAMIGSTMGPRNLMPFFAFVATQILLTAGQFAGRLRQPTSAIGEFLNVLAAHVALFLLVPTLAYLPIALAICILSWARLVTGLRRFAILSPAD